MEVFFRTQDAKWKRAARDLIFFLVAVGWMVIMGAPSAVAASDSLELTLKDSIDIALEQNLGIKAVRFDIPISQASKMKEKGEFDPGFDVELGQETADVQSPSTLTPTEEDVLSGDLSFGGKMVTGMTYDLRWANERVESNLEFLLNSPYHRSDFTLTLSQPFLKNFGKRVQESGLSVAENNLEISRLKLSEEASDVALETIKSYWELSFARDNSEVSKFSLDLAINLLEEVKARIEAGKLAPVEVFAAEAEVAKRQENLIRDRRVVGNSEDRLRSVIYLREWDRELIPVDLPPAPVEPIPLDQAIDDAFKYRRDYRQAQVDFKNKEILRMFYKNQKLSELDLFASAGLNGVNDKYSDALDDMLSGEYLSWQAGVRYTFLIGNRTARGNYSRAVNEEDQTAVAIKALEQQIKVEVREAWRNLTIAIEAIDSAVKTKIATEKKLQAEEEKFKVGKATVNDVSRFQEEYSRALSSEARIKAAYAVSLAELERAKGTLVQENSEQMEIAAE
ncbi:TolC family protein [bacterium]|nr:MAG: TolC family protein [bacterium]